MSDWTGYPEEHPDLIAAEDARWDAEHEARREAERAECERLDGIRAEAFAEGFKAGQEAMRQRASRFCAEQAASCQEGTPAHTATDFGAKYIASLPIEEPHDAQQEGGR